MTWDQARLAAEDAYGRINERAIHFSRTTIPHLRSSGFKNIGISERYVESHAGALLKIIATTGAAAIKFPLHRRRISTDFLIGSRELKPAVAKRPTCRICDLADR